MARRKTAARKQRVVLRFKRREQLKHRLRSVVVPSIIAALIVGFGAGLTMGGSPVLSRFVHRHTPQVDVEASSILTGFPILTELPRHPFWLWFPGSGSLLQRRVCRKYLAVRAVSLKRLYESNHVVIHLEPRVPLVSWHGAGLDKEGVLFAITPGAWSALPQADFLAAASRRDISRWLMGLASVPDVWPEVISIKEDASETMELTLKSGAVVIWGLLETESVARKAQTLARVLDDAHTNMGGAARADLRFFDQGRIIVLPKTARR